MIKNYNDNEESLRWIEINRIFSYEIFFEL